MRELILSMKGVCKTFSSDEMDIHALRNIDLEIYKGDFVSICGPSGCGKSTLLSLLGLLDQPSSGQYIIAGIDANRLSLSDAAVHRNEKIGFIFQSFNLIDELSAFDNVALPLRYSRNKISEQQLRLQVMASLAQVDIAHRAHFKPAHLSGGQQQRVAIARALVCNPTLLLVDEPTGNLDSRNGDRIMELLQQVNSNGTTLCMVTHDLRYADLARRQLHLLDGQIIQTAQQHSL
ncbi:MAG TPA: ABC transporter ATP-binding protein [Cellvibrio sp.]|nr:ABC transporter ATP-binding protein [Cellvibrio sp.]